MLRNFNCWIWKVQGKHEQLLANGRWYGSAPAAMAAGAQIAWECWPSAKANGADSLKVQVVDRNSRTLATMAITF